VVGGGAGPGGGGGRVGRLGGWHSGREPGARVRRCGAAPQDIAPTTLGPCHARADGFDLHAGLVVRAGQRDRLERVCRYALRPPLAQERLHRTSDGEIWLTLRHRWADGTTHLRFDPLELLERLAVFHPTAQETRDGDPGVDATTAGQPGSVLRCARAACPVARRSFQGSHTEPMLAKAKPRKTGTQAAQSLPGLARISGPS
jgi:Putative transposase